MTIKFDRDLTEEEKSIIYDKIKGVEFYDYDLKWEDKDFAKKYEENIHGNDTLSLLFDFVTREVKVDEKRTYHDKGKRTVINNFAKKNKKNLFYIQLLSAILGNADACQDIGSEYIAGGKKEEAYMWYKKALMLGYKEKKA